MHVFKINGTQFTYPTQGAGSLNNLHSADSGRSELTGLMIMEAIRKGVNEMTLEWQFLPAAEASKLYNYLNNNDFFDITIHDLKTNTDATNTYYLGTFDYKFVSFAKGDLYYHITAGIIMK